MFAFDFSLLISLHFYVINDLFSLLSRTTAKIFVFFDFQKLRIIISISFVFFQLFYKAFYFRNIFLLTLVKQV